MAKRAEISITLSDGNGLTVDISYDKRVDRVRLFFGSETAMTQIYMPKKSAVAIIDALKTVVDR